jgi:hypothetical protein
MQSLKIFIETVMDFSPQLEGLTEYNKYSFEKLTERRSEAHMQADGLIKHIKYAKTLDNFESGELQFSFTAKNMDEYRRKLQKLESDSDLVRQLFDIVGAP